MILPARDDTGANKQLRCYYLYIRNTHQTSILLNVNMKKSERSQIRG